MDHLRSGDRSWRDNCFGRGAGTIDWSHNMATGSQRPFATTLTPGRYGFFTRRVDSGANRVESNAVLTLIP